MANGLYSSLDEKRGSGQLGELIRTRAAKRADFQSEPRDDTRQRLSTRWVANSVGTTSVTR